MNNTQRSLVIAHNLIKKHGKDSEELKKFLEEKKDIKLNEMVQKLGTIQEKKGCGCKNNIKSVIPISPNKPNKNIKIL